MRYYTEPLMISKSRVQFMMPTAATEFFKELALNDKVYGLEKLGNTITYWCLDRNYARSLAVDYEHRWMNERNQQI